MSERLLIAKFSHTLGILAVFVAYVPTNTSPDSDKNSFYAELDYHIQNLKPSDVVPGLKKKKKQVVNLYSAYSRASARP